MSLGTSKEVYREGPMGTVFHVDPSICAWYEARQELRQAAASGPFVGLEGCIGSGIIQPRAS